MENIDRLKAEAAAHAMLILMVELDRTHGEGFAKCFLEEHGAAIFAVLGRLESAVGSPPKPV